MALIDTILQVIGIVCIAAVIGSLFMPAIMIWALLALVGWAILYIFWVNYYNSKMAWTLPYWNSWKSGHFLLVFLTKLGTMVLRDDAKYMAGAAVIDNEKAKEFYAFIKSDKAIFKAGPAIAQLAYDGCNVLLNPEYVLGVMALRKRGINHIDELQDRIEKGEFDGFVDNELGLEMTLKGEMDKKKVYIPMFRAIDVHAVKDWISGDPSIEKAMIDTAVLAERRAQEKTGLMNNPNVLVFVMIIFAISVGAYILTR